MTCEAILALPDGLIDRVVFYKRPEVRVDPMCCEVFSNGLVFCAYEEAPAWQQTVDRLERLPGFLTNWKVRISDPPFERIELIAYDRAGQAALTDDRPDLPPEPDSI